MYTQTFVFILPKILNGVNFISFGTTDCNLIGFLALNFNKSLDPNNVLFPIARSCEGSDVGDMGTYFNFLCEFESLVAAAWKRSKTRERRSKEIRRYCKHCDYTTFFSDDFKSHKLLHKMTETNINRREDESKRKNMKAVERAEELKLILYKCAKCGFWTTRKDKHEVHKRRHVHNSFVCLHCRYGTHIKKDIKRHFKTCEKRKIALGR